MPAMVRRKGNTWRVVERNGSPVANTSGTPVDGGGHSSQREALAQARAINSKKHGGRSKRSYK